MDARCRLELLGWLRVEQAGREITRFQTRKTGALLGYLAFHLHRSHAREVLTEILWPEEDPPVARHKLRVALSSLRRQLEPPGVPAGAVIIATRAALQLNPAGCSTEVAQFEALLQAASSAGSARARVQQLIEAVDLYRGELLPGYFEEWVQPQRQRLSEAYLQALWQLVALLEQQGDLPRALQFARRAVSAEPLREESHQELIRLLIAARQPEAALRQYLELEQLLDQELGAAPAPATYELLQELEQAGVRPRGTPPQQPQSRRPAGVKRRAEVRSAGRSTPAQQAARPRPTPKEERGQPSLSLEVGRQPNLARSARYTDLQPAAFLPTGTVTFLLAEVEALAQRPPPRGSSAVPLRGEREREPAAALLEEFHTPLRPLFRDYGGRELSVPAEQLQMAFGRASDALAAAVAAQRALAARWRAEEERRAVAPGSLPGAASPPGVRMALHTGEVAPGEEAHHTPALQHAARLLRAAHPGQILLSEKTRALLQDELEPGLQLVGLGLYHLREADSPERLFQADDPERRLPPFPPPKAPLGLRGHLPLRFTRFFGREEELSHLQLLLLPEAGSSAPRARLVTLTGPAACGKSRLAFELAVRLSAAFQGAVWFVSLADLADTRGIALEVLKELRLLPEYGAPSSLSGSRVPFLTPLEQLLAALSGQRAFLVLDGLEHLVQEGATVVRVLLEHLPELTVLVTSRQHLELEAEREFPILPLPTPTQMDTPERLLGCPSVQLFVDRAQAVRPDFQLTKSNAAAVAAVCQKLEGLPLALELAAARAGVLSPAQILERLAHRFDLLVSLRRDLPERHRSLRAALEWSYRLLPPELRWFLARLSVFRDGCTLEAAEAVCSDSGFPVLDSGLDRPGQIQKPKPEIQNAAVLEYLRQLQQASLVLAEDAGSAMRYRLLETLREYAAEQLTPGEQAALAGRHARYFVALTEQAEPELQGPQRESWLERREPEHDNLRAARDWCQAAGEAQLGLQLGGALRGFWQIRGYLVETD